MHRLLLGNVLGTTENKTLMNNYTYTKMCRVQRLTIRRIRREPWTWL